MGKDFASSTPVRYPPERSQQVRNWDLAVSSKETFHVARDASDRETRRRFTQRDIFWELKLWGSSLNPFSDPEKYVANFLHESGLYRCCGEYSAMLWQKQCGMS